MLLASFWRVSRPGLLPCRASSCPSLVTTRLKRYGAFDADRDQEALAEARSWFKSFDPSQLPRGNTSYARSSGPGGQHVNKTETKAVTTFPVAVVLSTLPEALHAGVRASRYYTPRTDCLSFSAQTHRSRSANADENHQKLVDELTRIYREVIPSETSEATKKKHEQIEKRFHQGRLQQKKFQSAKKQSRRGPPG